MVHHEFVPPGHTANGHFYVHVLYRLRDTARRKRHDRWQGEWFLHHDNAPSHTSLVVQQFLFEKAFLSSPNHRTLRISLRVTFGCSWLWKWASRGRVSQPWRTSNQMRRPNSGRFQKNPSVGASNSDRTDGTSVCVRKVIRWTVSYVLPLQCYTTIPWTFWLPLIYFIYARYILNNHYIDTILSCILPTINTYPGFSGRKANQLSPTPEWSNSGLSRVTKSLCGKVLTSSPVIQRKKQTTNRMNFDVLVTVHLSIILVIKQLNAQNLVL